MEDVVLETLMFSKPPEWGRRIVQRNDEILLQTTENRGKTWKDEPMEFKLIVPNNTTRIASVNPYAGLVFQSRNIETRGMQEELKPSPELQEVIESGKLLSVRYCSMDEKVQILQ